MHTFTETLTLQDEISSIEDSDESEANYSDLDDQSCQKVQILDKGERDLLNQNQHSQSLDEGVLEANVGNEDLYESDSESSIASESDMVSVISHVLSNLCHLLKTFRIM